MISNVYFLLALLCLLGVGRFPTITALKPLPAFTVDGTHRKRTTSSSSSSKLHTTTKNTKTTTSRKQFFQEIGIAGIAAAIFSSSTTRSSPAYALDLDGVGVGDSTTATSTSTSAEGTGGTVGSLLASPSLRNLKRAEKQLSKMEFYAVQNDFASMKEAIRNPPFSEVRKNSFQLIRDFKGEQSQQDKLQASYQKFITSLEKMDSMASLGLRGRKLENSALLQSYDATVKALNDWIEVASAVTQEGMLS